MRDRVFDGGLHWTTHLSEDPGAHLTSGFLDAENQRYLIRDHDADSFFMQLASQLDCFPPDLVRDPFGHLQETYNRIVDNYPKAEESGGQDILKQARERVQQAASVQPDSDEGTNATDLTNLRLALATGDYDRVVKAWEASDEPSSELTDMASSALTWQGAELAIAAQNERDANRARAGFEAAIERYAAAVEVKPDKHEALNNWGNALCQIAKREPDEERARAGFQATVEKFAVAQGRARQAQSAQQLKQRAE